MKKCFLFLLILLSVVTLCSCGVEYYDSESDNLDTESFAIDALDKALPEIAANISEEQLTELLNDERVYQIAEQIIVERLAEGELASIEFVDVEQIEEYLTFAYGDSERAKDDVANMYPKYGEDIIKGCMMGQ